MRAGQGRTGAAGVLRGRAGHAGAGRVRRRLPARAAAGVAQYGGHRRAPAGAAVPAFRLSPARFWKHRTGGLLPLLSGNEAFDARWLLLAAEDAPELRRLAQDPALQGLLLGSDDGDEFWSAAGFVAAVRPDGHRPDLIEHHARLLTAVVARSPAGTPADCGRGRRRVFHVELAPAGRSASRGGRVGTPPGTDGGDGDARGARGH